MFHDYMSHGVEGSILSENHLRINFGLCRWSQYINVLSDETGCDPTAFGCQDIICSARCTGIHCING